MDKEKLIERLKQKSEQNPNNHDGSYELVCETVKAYKDVPLQDLNFQDLDCIYLMIVGTLSHPLSKRKEAINKTHLPNDKKAHLCSVLDSIQDKADKGLYENHDNGTGMFGTGFYTFKSKTDNDSVQRFIKLCTDILPLQDDESLYAVAETALSEKIHGMRTATISEILHCLKPFSFPILNANEGYGNIFEKLGLELDNINDTTTYVSNCRKIKKFRDENFSVKNYRIFDRIESEMESDENIHTSSQGAVSISPIPLPRNRIIFGAPGTGKSHLLEQQRKNYFDDEHYERVTFHPNYSYAQFVGAYKPVTKSADGKEDITYSFVPGPFVWVLAKAIKHPSENFLLVIEEINRANVAAVFGDVFQLLDRDEDGKSEYPIDAGEDLKKYLGKSDVPLEGGKIAIPANMYIWATMNSADQGVMPLDAAFKRRWEFEYIGIDENENQVADYEIPKTKNPDGTLDFVRWNVFRKALNGKLKNLSGASVNEDKLLGPFFINRRNLETAKENAEDFIRLFKSKVLMYLYEDVCKMNPRALFSGIPDGGRLHYSDVCAAFDKKGLEIFGVDFLGKSDD